MIARVLYDKGYQEYVDAARYIQSKYSNVEFWLLGKIDNEYPNHVPKDVINRDSNDGIIKYLGYSIDVPHFIRKADCIVLPSYHEGLSRVLMEAIAMQKPVITTDIPGCRETVDDGANGYLIPPKNSRKLAEAIERFLHLSDAQKEEMGKYSRNKAEMQFDINQVISIYRKITG